MDAVMNLQQRITFDFLDGCTGKVADVLVENGEVARTVFQAPEVDGIVMSDHIWQVGGISKALITKREGYDLKGEPL